MPKDRGTPDLVRHCVAAVAKQYGGDTSKAFAICVASLQKAGYLKPGTMQLTAAGKKKEKQHESEPDAEKKMQAYEKLLKANLKEAAEEGYDPFTDSELMWDERIQRAAQKIDPIWDSKWDVELIASERLFDIGHDELILPFFELRSSPPDSRGKTEISLVAMFRNSRAENELARMSISLSALTLDRLGKMFASAATPYLKKWLQENPELAAKAKVPKKYFESTDYRNFFEALSDPTTRSGFEAIPRTVARRYERITRTESSLDQMRRLAGITLQHADRVLAEAGWKPPPPSKLPLKVVNQPKLPTEKQLDALLDKASSLLLQRFLKLYNSWDAGERAYHLDKRKGMFSGKWEWYEIVDDLQYAGKGGPELSRLLHDTHDALTAVDKKDAAAGSGKRGKAREDFETSVTEMFSDVLDNFYAAIARSKGVRTGYPDDAYDESQSVLLSRLAARLTEKVTKATAPKGTPPKKTLPQTLVDEIADMTDRNDHTAALTKAVQFVFTKDSGIRKKAEAFLALQDAYGYQPPGGDEIRKELYFALMKEVEREYGTSEWMRLRAAF